MTTYPVAVLPTGTTPYPFGCTPAWKDVPPTYRAILWGIREELEGLGFYSGLVPSHNHWEPRYWYGLEVFDKAYGHVASIFTHQDQLVVILAGDRLLSVIPTRNTVNPVYDLAGPDSIPLAIAAVTGIPR